MVCAEDGVPVTESRRGWLHTDEIPKGFEPHDVESICPREDWQREVEERIDVHGLAGELMEHHNTLHPFSECAWSQKLAVALRGS